MYRGIHFGRLLALGAALVVCSFAHAEQAKAPAAHFHHVHLNSTDPGAAIDFYTSRFKARRERFAGDDAVWTGASWLLFTKVAAAPPSGIVSGIWHIGWGAENMQETYRQQLERGTKFATPLSDISDMVGRSFFYAYVDGPDHALIELNTAAHHDFGHVHMFSADPAAAGAWYATQLGLRNFPQAERRIYRGVPIAPASFVTADRVSIIIYPVDYLKATAPQWQKRTALATTRGRVIDHIAFSVDDLDATLARLTSQGVRITEPARALADGNIRSAFLAGPDAVVIELIEDHTRHPAPLPD